MKEWGDHITSIVMEMMRQQKREEKKEKWKRSETVTTERKKDMESCKETRGVRSNGAQGTGGIWNIHGDINYPSI